VQSLEGFKRRFGGLDRPAFVKRFPHPFLVVEAPGPRGEALWVCRVRNRPDEGFFQEEISIGRTEENDICLSYDSVSKKHANITFEDERFQITDLNSRNGTLLAGLPLAPFVTTPLRSGQVMGLGMEVRAVFLTSIDFWTRVILESQHPFGAHGTEQD
jgi:pSer/pThr/pTyr-binding forkhead associated (FHA) protein